MFIVVKCYFDFVIVIVIVIVVVGFDVFIGGFNLVLRFCCFWIWFIIMLLFVEWLVIKWSWVDLSCVKGFMVYGLWLRVVLNWEVIWGWFGLGIMLFFFSFGYV